MFSYFVSNKRIILFLIEQQILNVDERVSNLIYLCGYWEYFRQEAKESYFKIMADLSDILSPRRKIDKYNESAGIIESHIDNITGELSEKRKFNESFNLILQSIQNDSIDVFIVLINKNCNDIKHIKTIPSIFETNNFLIQKNHT